MHPSPPPPHTLHQPLQLMKWMMWGQCWTSTSPGGRTTSWRRLRPTKQSWGKRRREWKQRGRGWHTGAPSKLLGEPYQHSHFGLSPDQVIWKENRIQVHHLMYVPVGLCSYMPTSITEFPLLRFLRIHQPLSTLYRKKTLRIQSHHHGQWPNGLVAG